MAQQVSNTTTDHETIRRWAEGRGAWPAAVEGTSRGEDDPGMIRIDFPGYSGEEKLRRIEWDQWFKKFDASGLALVYEDTTAAGQRSNFNELVARETAEASAEGGRASPRKRASAGGRGGARAGAKRGGGRREASRAAAARTTSRRGGGAGGRGARSKKGAGRSAPSRGQAGRGGRSRGGGRSKSSK